MEKKPNVAKILLITAAAVAGTCAVAYFIVRLLQKYFVLKDAEYNDLLDNEEEDGELVMDKADEDSEEEAAPEED